MEILQSTFDINKLYNSQLAELKSLKFTKVVRTNVISQNITSKWEMKMKLKDHDDFSKETLIH